MSSEIYNIAELTFDTTQLDTSRNMFGRTQALPA